MSAERNEHNGPHPLRDSLICSICLLPFSRPVVLRCSHTFCRKCLVALWNRGQRGCPNCRTSLLLRPSQFSDSPLLTELVKEHFPKAYDEACAQSCGEEEIDDESEDDSTNNRMMAAPARMMPHRGPAPHGWNPETMYTRAQNQELWSRRIRCCVTCVFGMILLTFVALVFVMANMVVNDVLFDRLVTVARNIGEPNVRTDAAGRHSLGFNNAFLEVQNVLRILFN